MTARQRFKGVFPVAPTTFDDRGDLDLESQLRCIDFLIDAGATGTMPSGAYPDALRRIVDDYHAGRRDEAVAGYERWLPLINYENRQCGLLACKVLMREGRIIASEHARHPIAPLHAATRAGLLEIARRLDPLVLRWAQ